MKQWIGSTGLTSAVVVAVVDRAAAGACALHGTGSGHRRGGLRCGAAAYRPRRGLFQDNLRGRALSEVGAGAALGAGQSALHLPAAAALLWHGSPLPSGDPASLGVAFPGRDRLHTGLCGRVSIGVRGDQSEVAGRRRSGSLRLCALCAAKRSGARLQRSVQHVPVPAGFVESALAGQAPDRRTISRCRIGMGGLHRLPRAGAIDARAVCDRAGPLAGLALPDACTTGGAPDRRLADGRSLGADGAGASVGSC